MLFIFFDHPKIKGCPVVFCVLPNSETLYRFGHREFNDRFETAGKQIVEIATSVGRKDNDAVEGIDALQEIRGFLVGIAIAEELVSVLCVKSKSNGSPDFFIVYYAAI